MAKGRRPLTVESVARYSNKVGSDLNERLAGSRHSALFDALLDRIEGGETLEEALAAQVPASLLEGRPPFTHTGADPKLLAMAARQTVAQMTSDRASMDGLFNLCWLALCARRWGRWRQAYRFDPALTRALWEGDVRGAPLSCLERLPYDAVWVEQEVVHDGFLGPTESSSFKGYFAQLCDAGGKTAVAVTLVAPCPDGEFEQARHVFPLDGTLEEAARLDRGSVHQTLWGRLSGRKGRDELDRARNDVESQSSSLWAKPLSQLLYLSSASADVRPAVDPFEPGPRKKWVQQAVPPSVSDVGRVIGAQITSMERAVQECGEARPNGRRKSPRPHIRRAHWTHVWTGPMSGDRELELRWVAPCLVGGEGPMGTTTVHEVNF